MSSSADFPKLAPTRPYGQGVLAGEHFALDTALSVGAGQGEVIEAGTGVPFALVLQDPEDADILEEVVVTAVDGDTLALGLGGLAGGWPSGTLARRMLVRAELQLMQYVIAANESSIGEVSEELAGAVEELVEFLETTGETIDQIVAVSGGLLDGTLEVPGLTFKKSDTTGFGPFLDWTYTRGTAESPADTVEGDFAGRLTFYGWHGSKKRMGGLQVYQAAGAPGTSAMPGWVSLFAVDASNNVAGGVTLGPGGATLYGANSTLGGALKHLGSTAGFFNTTPVTRPAITGWSGKTAEQKVDALKDALVALGLVAVS